MYDIVYLPLAKKDIEDIVYYISNNLNSPKAALKLLEDFDSLILSLRRFPFSHPVYRTIKPLKEDYRMVPVHHYAVFYVVRDQEKVVEIYRIVYAKRDLLRIVPDFK